MEFLQNNQIHSSSVCIYYNSMILSDDRMDWMLALEARQGKGLGIIFPLSFQSENILTTCLFNKIKECIHIHDLRPGPTDRWFHFFYSDVLDCWQSFLKEAVIEETQ